MENKYVNRSKNSEAKCRRLVKRFAIGLTAADSAELCILNRHTVNRFCNAFRDRIVEYCAQTSPVIGEIEVDKSCFGSRRVRGKRDRGAGSKTIVFWFFERDGKVYTGSVSGCKAVTLQAIIRGRVDIEPVSHSDGGHIKGLCQISFNKILKVLQKISSCCSLRKRSFVSATAMIISIGCCQGYSRADILCSGQIPFELRQKCVCKCIVYKWRGAYWVCRELYRNILQRKSKKGLYKL